jgi:hypothetical protein
VNQQPSSTFDTGTIGGMVQIGGPVASAIDDEGRGRFGKKVR